MPMAYCIKSPTLGVFSILAADCCGIVFGGLFSIQISKPFLLYFMSNLPFGCAEWLLNLS